MKMTIVVGTLAGALLQPWSVQQLSYAQYVSDGTGGITDVSPETMKGVTN